MEDKYLTHYIGEIVTQAAAVRLSVDALNKSLASPGTAAGTGVAFAAAQGLLGAAMQITRLLWPYPASRHPDGTPLTPAEEKRRAWTLERASALRAAVRPINEQTSPLRFRRSETSSSTLTSTWMSIC